MKMYRQVLFVYEENFNHIVQSQSSDVVNKGYEISAMTATPDQENVPIVAHNGQLYY